jgi:hypothetical protein
VNNATSRATLWGTLTSQPRSTEKARSEHHEAHGYGFGVAVAVDPETANPAILRRRCRSRWMARSRRRLVAGRPTERSVMILLTHNMVTLEQLADGVGLGAWDATTQFQTLGSAFPTNIGESRTC